MDRRLALITFVVLTACGTNEPVAPPASGVTDEAPSPSASDRSGTDPDSPVSDSPLSDPGKDLITDPAY